MGGGCSILPCASKSSTAVRHNAPESAAPPHQRLESPVPQAPAGGAQARNASPGRTFFPDDEEARLATQRQFADLVRQKRASQTIPETPAGKNAERFPFFCPICFHHCREIYQTECCSHHVCEACGLEHLNKHLPPTSQDQQQVGTMVTELPRLPSSCACPHCNTANVQFSKVRSKEQKRRYQESPATKQALARAKQNVAKDTPTPRDDREAALSSVSNALLELFQQNATPTPQEEPSVKSGMYDVAEEDGVPATPGSDEEERVAEADDRQPLVSPVVVEAA